MINYTNVKNNTNSVGDDGHMAFSCSISMSVTEPAPVVWNNNSYNEGERKILHNSPPPVILILSEWDFRLYF